jgi:hypothetical protein
MSEKGLKKKHWKKSLKKPQSKPYIVTHWHATLNFDFFWIQLKTSPWLFSFHFAFLSDQVSFFTWLKRKKSKNYLKKITLLYLNLNAVVVSHTLIF